MPCCAECIGDSYLRQEVIPLFSSEIGTCTYCGSEDVELVDPEDLKEHFEILSGIYTPTDEGKTLVEWFKEDWLMFDHSTMAIPNANQLLADIFDDGNIIRQRFFPSELCNSSTLATWEEFRQELKHENRFFPKTNLDSERINDLLNLLVHTEALADTWYRARIQRGDTVLTPDNMGAPPEKLSSHGRANPAGIPYLYLASNITTAISEIRPHTGELTNVATFTIPPVLKLIDLRHPRKTISPFLLADENTIAQLRGDIEFLENLGEELTRPILPEVAAIDYIPSQYLCEFIKTYGYHGVMYRSSVGDGINIALFEPDSATVGEVTSHKVTRVVVDVEDN